MSNDELNMDQFEQDWGFDYSPHIENSLFTQLADTKDRLNDLKGILTFRKDLSDGIEEKIADLREVEKIIRKALEDIMALIRPERNEQDELAKRMRQDKYTIAELERQLAKLEAEIMDRMRLARDRAKIDASTANALWRIGVDGDKALPHQLEGAQRMAAARRSILGDLPGLGKTLQSIMAINMLREQGTANKVLIVTLKPVLPNFEREIRKWYPGQYTLVLNQTRKGLKAGMLEVVADLPQAIVITNYEVWRRDPNIRERLKQCQFDTMIFDEAHGLADQTSQTSRTVKELVYAVNQCNKCDAFVHENDKVKDIYGRWDYKCKICGAKPEKFEDFRSVKNVFPMTGTPLLNKPHDLFPMLNLIDNHAFPELGRFLDDYCMQKCSGCGASHRMYCVCDVYDRPPMRWVFRDGGPERLLKSLGMKFTQRSRESAGVIMPPQDVVRHELELDEENYPRQFEFIQMLNNDAKIAFADGEKLTLDETLAWYTRMRQSPIWPDAVKIYDNTRDLETGEKINPGLVIWPSCSEDLPGESIIMDEAEADILKAVEAGDRVIVASNFKEALFEMQRRLELRGIRQGMLAGGVSEKMRQTLADDFNETITPKGKHQFDVMLMQYRAGSTGLNLHGAQEIVLLDREWNPGKEQQMMDRVRRIGSKYSSIVHTYHVAGSGTELIDALQAQKKAMLSGFESGVIATNLQDVMRKFLGES